MSGLMGFFAGVAAVKTEPDDRRPAQPMDEEVEVVQTLSQEDRNNRAKRDATYLSAGEEDEDELDDSDLDDAPPAAPPAAAAAPPVAAALAAVAAQPSGAPAALNVAPYKKAFAVTGDTKTHKTSLKKLGGRWNGKLVAWIFPLTKQEEVVGALRDEGITVAVSATQYNCTPTDSGVAAVAAAVAARSSPRAGAATAAGAVADGKHALSVERYKKCVLVKGETKPVADTLKALGGKWQSSLGGWIFGGKQKSTNRLLTGLRADPAITLCLADGVESGAPSRESIVTELEALKPSQLRKRAAASGVAEEQIEEAEDGETPKDSLIELIAAAETAPAAPQQGGAAAPAPRPLASGGAAQPPPAKRPKLEPHHVHPQLVPEPVEQWVEQKDPNKPKRPLSAFFFFSKVKRAEVIAENPEMSRQIGEMAKLCGAAWKTMNAAAKAPYVSMASQDGQRYKDQMATYQPLPKVLVIHKQVAKPRASAGAAAPARQARATSVTDAGAALAADEGLDASNIVSGCVCCWLRLFGYFYALSFVALCVMCTLTLIWIW